MKQKQSYFLIPGIILLGIVLRSPFTTLSTVLSDIASGLGVEVSSLGLLTSLPLLTFAIFSPFAASWAKRFGIERLFLGVLIVMTLGSALRTVNRSPSLCGNDFSRSGNCLCQRPSPKPHPSQPA